MSQVETYDRSDLFSLLLREIVHLKECGLELRLEQTDLLDKRGVQLRIVDQEDTGDGVGLEQISAASGDRVDACFVSGDSNAELRNTHTDIFSCAFAAVLHFGGFGCFRQSVESRPVQRLGKRRLDQPWQSANRAQLVRDVGKRGAFLRNIKAAFD